MTNRRLPHILCSLLLVITSLAPGRSWAMCFEASGRVVVEAIVRAADPATEESPGTGCATECPPDRCHDCRDVRLDVVDRACPRREASSVDLVILPVYLELPGEPVWADPVGLSRATATPATASPHLILVLRC